jgi:uncharacterized protein YqeY
MSPTSDPNPAYAAEMAMRARLAGDLKTALRARDIAATAALRSMIAALDNAGAVPAAPGILPTMGLSRDAPRRVLSAEDIDAVLGRELGERHAAIADYENGGRKDAADRLRAEIEVIARHRAAVLGARQG